ncbi:hypothetical protein ACJJV6_03125 [Arthrobacter nitrophenolicus]|uniref:Uncharacterized protein n=2 Tax=Arthrobacter nitrophenolicus TaxID=683150 RepID=A0ACC6TD96_9MICC|nr:hypothetical protein [Arthrobacter nitrophenolicus]
MRNSIITLGLAALLALSYYSAGSSSPSALPAHASNHTNPSPTAAGGRIQPGPADTADPANRQQTSLEAAAGREHPTGSAPETQGPPPQLREKVTPSQVFGGAAPGTGGCLPEYGEDGQCLPAVPPSLARHVSEMRAAGQDPSAMDHRWSCSEVRKYFRDGLAVRQPGIDPQGLDTNSDGKACAAGDR